VGGGGGGRGGFGVAGQKGKDQVVFLAHWGREVTAGDVARSSAPIREKKEEGIRQGGT